MNQFISRASIALFLAGAAHVHATTTFSVTPGGDPSYIAGEPGTTIGWGFSIFNDTDWLVITNSGFCSGSNGPYTAADLGSNPDCTSNALGTYSDLMFNESTLTNTFTVGPRDPPNPNGGPSDAISQTQNFDFPDQLGLGEFAIDSGAVIGSITTGQLVISYDLWSVSPNNPAFDPTADSVSRDNVFIVDAVVQAVPEPGSLLLLALVTVAFSIRRSGRQSHRA